MPFPSKLNTKKIIAWSLVIIWMGFIFYLSHQPESESAKLSKGTTRLIAETIQKIFPELEPDVKRLEHILRKLAHFFSFLILGIFAVNAFSLHKKIPKYQLLSLLFCIIYAITDEAHQVFISGRSGEIRDIMIDMSGSATGIILYLLFYRTAKK